MLYDSTAHGRDVNAPITYLRDFVAEPDLALDALLHDLAWIRVGDTPRWEYYWSLTGEPYTYGRAAGQRMYEAQPDHSAIVEMRARLRDELSLSFDVCFLNRYDDQRDHLGWHADDSPELDDNRPIAIVSLGVAREIWFKRKGGIDASTERRLLEPGSLCIMAAGMQQAWLHRIPKAGFVCGPRVSLTYRGLRSRTREAP